jgi:hypothetical protein
MGAAGGNNFSHPTPGVSDIAAVARNNVDMKVKYSLAGKMAYISPDVVSIGVMLFLKQFFNFKNQLIHGSVFFLGSIEKSLYMSLRYNQGMAFADRAGIVKSQGKVIFSNYFH